MKKVYVVTGSEDGILGVASNFKAAYRMGREYITNEDNQYCSERYEIVQSYSQALKDKNYCTLERKEDRVTVRIEMNYLYSK